MALTSGRSTPGDSPSQASPSERVGARLQRLEDRAAIQDLLARYAHLLDTHLVDRSLDDQWVDCFTDDAVWDICGGPRAARYRGREELMRFITSHDNDPPVYQHVVSTPAIHLQEDQAWVRSYLVRLEYGNAGPILDAFGSYQDVVVRCRDGAWRFSHRRVDVWSDPDVGVTGRSARMSAGPTSLNATDPPADYRGVHR